MINTGGVSWRLEIVDNKQMMVFNIPGLDTWDERRWRFFCRMCRFQLPDGCEPWRKQ